MLNESQGILLGQCIIVIVIYCLVEAVLEKYQCHNSQQESCKMDDFQDVAREETADRLLPCIFVFHMYFCVSICVYIFVYLEMFHMFVFLYVVSKQSVWNYVYHHLFGIVIW
jgi:hypothetical protein